MHILCKGERPFAPTVDTFQYFDSCLTVGIKADQLPTRVYNSIHGSDLLCYWVDRIQIIYYRLFMRNCYTVTFNIQSSKLPYKITNIIYLERNINAVKIQFLKKRIMNDRANAVRNWISDQPVNCRVLILFLGLIGI